MASLQYFWIFVAILVIRNIAGHDAARLKRQTSDDLQMTFLQQLQKWSQEISAQNYHVRDPENVNLEQISKVLTPHSQETADQALDVENMMHLVNSVQQTGKNRIEFQLGDGDVNDPNSPSVNIVVETLSAEDLLATDKGRQQLSQLNAQLEQAVDSLNQGVQMAQGPDQAVTMLEQVQNATAEAVLGGLVHMLIGGDQSNTILGILGSQSLNAVNQLTQTLDHLPGLKEILGKFYRLVEHIHSSSSSATKNMQQLLVSAAMAVQGLSGRQGQRGSMEEIDDMLAMALTGLNANLELLEHMVNSMQQTVNSPSFPLALDNTHCLVKGLGGDLSTEIAAGCLQNLMQALAMVNQSEHVVSSLLNSLNNLLDNPRVLQSFTDLMKLPNLNTALNMIQRMAEDLKEADADLADAMHTLQNMLQSLWNNQPLLEIVSNFLQNPGSSQVYQDAMQFLKDASLGDATTQQLLKAVNDSISTIWREENARSVVQKLQEILTELKNGQHITQPLSQSQQALLDLLNKLLEAAQNAINSGEEITTLTPAITTGKPVVTSTKGDYSATVDRTTTSPPSTSGPLPSMSSRSSDRTQTWSTRSSGNPRSTTPSGEPGTMTTSRSVGELSLTPRTTRNPDTDDSNGSASVSFSAFTLITVLFSFIL